MARIRDLEPGEVSAAFDVDTNAGGRGHLYRIENKSCRLRVAKNFFAFGSLFRAARKSSGISICADLAYAFSHRRSLRAASTCASPAGVMRPSSISFLACSRFLPDQPDLNLRGDNLCKKEMSSRGFFCPSIHP